MDGSNILCYIAYLLVHFVDNSLANITTDQSALLALKSHLSFGSSNNVLEKNWTTSSSVCTWIGVTCGSRHLRVTALDISDMGLTGIIPPEMGNLSFLNSLDISNNSFFGNLPEELAQLRRLRSLDFRRNNFSGAVPAFFSALPNLRFLYLSRNKFSGSIPLSFSNVSKLEELTLNLNFLEGSIPEGIGNLHNLTFLNLEGNELTGSLPMSMFNISSLQYIALSGNNLRGKLPVDICNNLPMLEGLYLSSNYLDGLIPRSIHKCSQLQVLSISNNEFGGIIPREMGNLSMLTVLHVGGNYLEGPLPAEIGDLQRLEVFGLNYNSLRDSIPASIFNISALQVFTLVGNYFSGNLPSNLGHGVPNIEAVYFGMNNLSGIIPDSISNASKLTILDLSNNSFSGPIPDSLGDLESLELLNLGDNNLEMESSSSEMRFLTSLTKCRRLKELVIGENPLNGILPSFIGNLSTSLQIFAAYRCKIRGNLPEEIGNLSRLALLSLFDNELTGFIPRTIDGLQSLQQLYLDNNKIRGSFPSIICNLQNLGAIGLSENQISGPVPSCIGNISTLRNLYLAYNNLSSILPSSLWMLKDLLKFNVSSNLLSGHLPPEIGNLNAVTLIDLSMNNFSGKIPSSVDGLENLISLSLAHNELEGPIPDSLGKVLSLEVLDLSFNNLTGVIPQALVALSYLKQINVSFNNLSGEIPRNGPFVNFTSESFLSNDALCGSSQFKVLQCPAISPHRRSRRKKSFLIVYILLGISLLIIASVLPFALIRWQKRKKATLETGSSLGISNERISFYELKRGTNGFDESNLLGAGGYGSVYKGVLTDGTLVAIKVFNLELVGAFQCFERECDLLRNLRHRNLTKVITSCSNQDFRALVLEYMPNGSLEKWLYSHNCYLDMFQRLDIMIDVACALDYLHNGYSSPVVHCDLKPSNVLLDTNMMGHVCDFGIAKLLGVEDETAQTKTVATIGYMAPEYGLEGLVSTKSDVYSYGIVLMETFTRKRPSDEKFVGDKTLRSWIESSIPCGIMQLVDPNLLKSEEECFDAKGKCLLFVMELALNCTKTSPDARMNIQEVLSGLRKIRTQLQRSCDRS